MHKSLYDLGFLNREFFAAVGPFNPQLLKLTCCDPRMSSLTHSLPAGQVFNPRSLGANVPKNLSTDSCLMDQLCLADLKGVRNFLIAPHSDCLAAEIALVYPHKSDLPKEIHQNNYRHLHSKVEMVGANLRMMSEECWDEARQISVTGNMKELLPVAKGLMANQISVTGNMKELIPIAKGLMAKKLSIISFENFKGLKVLDDQTRTIGDAMKSGDAQAAVVYIDLDNRRFERLDHDTLEFSPIN